MSDLILKARQLQREYDGLFHALLETGDLDRERIGRMHAIRHDILTSSAESALDQLMQFGCIKSVAAFLFQATEQNPEDAKVLLETMRESLAEIIIGLNTMRLGLEEQAGHTLEDLGLFVDGKTLQ